MKVLTFSRFFPKGHPKAGKPTYFVEKIWKQLGKAGVNTDEWINKYVSEMKCDLGSWYDAISKYHTIRVGNRWKAGDIASLRVWSGAPYRSKQIEFAQVEIKKTWDIEINNRFGSASFEIVIDGKIFGQLHYGNDKDINESGIIKLANNDGLHLSDFVAWFELHRNKGGLRFKGQIICWDDNIHYR